MLNEAIVVTFLAGGLFAAGLPPENHAAKSWDRKAAAAYLDKREVWWRAWPPATLDHGTFCISCHTGLPYALSRPALRSALAEQAPSAVERRLLDSVTKRVRLWKNAKPFYSNEEKGSRGTEAVLNALILANSDAPTGRLSGDTRTAFDNMWALQESTGAQKGAWPWLNHRSEPWEANDSPYYGASLAAVAVGTAPENYRAEPGIRNKLELLRGYLARESPKQSLMNQVFLLWASAKVPGIIGPQQKKSIIDEVLGKQQADGGWSLSSLAWSWRATSPYSIMKLWTRSEASPLEAKSDGVATGLIAFVLQQGELPPPNAQLQRALAWLVSNQNPTEGRWPGYSLNKRHDPSSPTGLFMSDAATAYAVLALTSSN